MEEEGSWPRLGLLLLSSVAVLWLVLCLLAFLSLYVSCPYDRGLLGGFIDQPPRGTMVMLQVSGSVLSASGDPGWVSLEVLWFAGFP